MYRCFEDAVLTVFGRLTAKMRAVVYRMNKEPGNFLYFFS